MIKRVMAGLMCLPLITPPPISNPQFKAEIINHKEQIKVRNIKDVEQEIKERTNKYLLNCYMEQIINKYRDKQEQERIQDEIEYRQNNPTYNPYNLKEISGIGYDKMFEILEGKPIQKHSEFIVDMEQIYGVNALFVVGILGIESGFGTSYRAVNHNNLAGYNIYGDDSYFAFDSQEACIEEVFRLISEEYLSEDGLFYNGTSIWNVNKLYCTNDNWASKINQIIYELIVDK